MHSTRSLVLGILLLGCVCPVWSQKPDNVTSGEMALLPEYCIDTQLFKYGDRHSPSPRAPYWISMMGENFWGFHHYCWALIRVQRSKAVGVSEMIRRGLLAGAIADYQYVIANSTSDFVMLPEVFWRLGESYVAIGSYGQAMDAFTKSRDLKPDYWPPYVAWADVLLKTGKKKEALAHVEEALRRARNDLALQGHYKRMGGDPTSFLRNLTPAAPAAASAAK